MTLPEIPRVRLGEFPTPVERAPAISRAAGREVWVKRDDLTARDHGGSKVRKLEFVLGDLRARGARRLVTVGGTGSNHILATGFYAPRLGIAVEAVVFPQPPTDAALAVAQAIAATGARVRRVPHPLLVPLGAAGPLLRGARLVPPGGSSPAGVVGYVLAARELAMQVRAGALPEPSEIFVALGTGGTAAGIALGLALAGLRTRVVAVRVVARAWANALVVRRHARAAARRLGVEGRTAAVHVVHDFAGPGYGWPTPEAEDAVRIAREDGLLLETTYTGKALAALIARPGGGPALFWNTFNSRPLPGGC